MPIKHEYWTCEICGAKEKTQAHALICEARGLPQEYPVGLIFGDSRPGAFYEGIVFAIFENKTEGHTNYPTLWACRTDRYTGDSLGEDVCCGGNNVRLNNEDSMVDPHSPEFLRMVRFLLNREDIEPTVWDGEQAIPLNNWLAARGLKYDVEIGIVHDKG
jgi:hypothetical protein